MTLLRFLSIAGVLALAMPARAEDKPAASEADHHEHMAAFVECARVCHQCALMCDVCGAHCVKLATDGKKEHLTTHKTCQDCATTCAAAAAIVARMGPFSDVICQACADTCKRCGEACAKHDDKMMKQCADECFKCEKACREMLKHVAHAK